jgi:hypothetical protein
MVLPSFTNNCSILAALVSSSAFLYLTVLHKHKPAVDNSGMMSQIHNLRRDIDKIPVVNR